VTGRAAAVASCTLVAVSLAVGQALALTDVVLAKKSAAGVHASAVPSAQTTRPYNKLVVFVTAQPNQRVTGSWTISCHFAGSGSSRDAEDFKGRTPLGVAVRTGSLGPGSTCFVVGAAKLARRGRITVSLVAH
jgi:hypothetical protein